MMKLSRSLKVSAKVVALEVVAVAGVAGYVLLSNSLPEHGGTVLAGLVLILLTVAVTYAVVRAVMRVCGLWSRR
jgi:hypothetical protein